MSTLEFMILKTKPTLHMSTSVRARWKMEDAHTMADMPLSTTNYKSEIQTFCIAMIVKSNSTKDIIKICVL